MNVNLQSPPSCVLEDYKVSAFQLVTPEKGKKQASLDVECRFCPDDNNSEKYVVKLGIRYTGKVKKAFSIKILVNGYFFWRGGYKQKEGDSFRAWVNGGTILYGLARATVAEITGCSECGKVLLPTVMMVDIVNDQIDQALKNIEKREADASVK